MKEREKVGHSQYKRDRRENPSGKRRELNRGHQKYLRIENGHLCDACDVLKKVIIGAVPTNAAHQLHRSTNRKTFSVTLVDRLFLY